MLITKKSTYGSKLCFSKMHRAYGGIWRFDITGCDAFSYIEDNDLDSKIYKMLWYDFISSLTDKPVYDSEDHIIMNYSDIYSDDQAKHLRYTLWQGVIHGRDATSIWLWSRSL